MRALEASDRPTGVASSLANTIPIMMSGLAATSLSLLHDNTAQPLAITILGLVCIAAVAYTMALKETGRKE